MAVENLIAEPVHPGAALADFAVGHRRKVAAERAAEGAHHLLDAVEWHAAHQQKIISHFSLTLQSRPLTQNRFPDAVQREAVHR